MAKPYGMELRERVAAAVAAGESRRSAARRFGVSESVAVKWLQRLERTGSVVPGRMGGHRRPALDGEREWVLARIAEKPDLTLRALAAELAERRGEGEPLRGLVVLPARAAELQKKACTRPSRTGRT